MATLRARDTLSPDEAALIQSLGKAILYDALIVMVESMFYGTLLVSNFPYLWSQITSSLQKS